MKATAIAKIKAEMDANKTNGYVQAVGAFLLEYVEQNPSAAHQLSATDKTVAKSLEAMRTEASKNKVNNVAVVAPREGFAIVLKYFGISGQLPPMFGAVRESITVKSSAPPASKSPSAGFDIKLEDLL